MSECFWSPDSCSCVLVYNCLIISGVVQTGNQRANFKRTEKYCNLHTGINGIGHHDAVITHNSSFNEKFPNLTAPEFPKMELEDSLKLAKLINNGEAISTFTKMIQIRKNKENELRRTKKL